MTDNSTSAATSTRPYLIRAIREWSMDNGMTPQILVDAGFPGVQVPEAYVQEGRIVLNVHERAVDALVMGNDEIVFSTRFGGVSHAVVVPVTAVQAVYARENNQGIYFQTGDPDSPDDGTGAGNSEATAASRESAAKRPNLKLVQ